MCVAGGEARSRRTRGRRELVQEMPALPRGRRGRQEQGRPGAQRARRAQVRHDRGLQLHDANKNSGITWDEATFKEYITDPRAKIPGTKMVFAGIKNERSAANLWAYLKQFDAKGEKK
jgi:hypothetical protein